MSYDFWNQGINPITGFKPILHNLKKYPIYDKKDGRYIKAKELDGFTSAKQLSKELGIGFKKVRQLFKSIGVHYRVNNASSFYPNDKIQEVKNLILEAEKMDNVDLSNYVTNTDLMQMFGFTGYKAWSVASKENLTKFRFKGNILYYEREKALEVFSKYKS